VCEERYVILSFSAVTDTHAQILQRAPQFRSAVFSRMRGFVQSEYHFQSALSHHKKAIQRNIHRHDVLKYKTRFICRVSDLTTLTASQLMA
jgi:hypothetical protein